MSSGLRVRLSPFGCGDVASWLQRFSLCATANRWKNEELHALLPAFLEGQALAVYQGLSEDDKKDVGQVKAGLLAAFRDPSQLAMGAFQSRSLKPGESVDEFAYHLRRLLSDAMPNMTNATARDAMLAHQLVAGLPTPIRAKILELSDDVTLATAIKTAKRLLALHLPKATAASVTPAPESIAPIAPSQPDLAAVLSKQMELTSVLTDKMKEMSLKIEQLSRPRQPFHGVCWNCGNEGHSKRNCPRLSQMKQNVSYSPSNTYAPRAETQQPAHVSFSSPPHSTVPPPTTVVYVDACINGRHHRCLIDTGAGVSLIPPSFIDGRLVPSAPIPLEVANGSIIHTLGTVTLRVCLGDAVLHRTFHVADVTTGIILGADFLRQHGVDISFSNVDYTF